MYSNIETEQAEFRWRFSHLKALESAEVHHVIAEFRDLGHQINRFLQKRIKTGKYWQSKGNKFYLISVATSLKNWCKTSNYIFLKKIIPFNRFAWWNIQQVLTWNICKTGSKSISCNLIIRVYFFIYYFLLLLMVIFYCKI